MVEQQTWMTLVGCASLAVALAAYLAVIFRHLRDDISKLRTELKDDTAQLRTELKDDTAQLRTELRADLGSIDARLISLENRTYDISSRLPAAPVTKP